MPEQIAQPNLKTESLSNNGLTQIILLLNDALSKLNSAECVYIDEKITYTELRRELSDLWMSAYGLRKKYEHILPSINNSNA